MTPRVVLYTCWPEPGAAKTRLIPVVRASAPSAFHRCLTESALDVMRDNGLLIEVRASGAPLPQFREWPREEPMLMDQGDGDVGAWLLRAAESPLVLFGVDIPDALAACLPAGRFSRISGSANGDWSGGG